MSAQPTQPSLYERLGGIYSIACVVDDLIDRVMTDPRLNESDIPFFPGIIMVVGLVVTLPPAVIYTIIALFLVGPRRAKLAWMSLCLFALPVLFGIAIGIWDSIFKS